MHLNFAHMKAKLISSPGGVKWKSPQLWMVVEHCVIGLVLSAHPVQRSQRWPSYLSIPLAALETVTREFNYFCQREQHGKSLFTSSIKVPQASKATFTLTTWPSSLPSNPHPSYGLQMCRSVSRRDACKPQSLLQLSVERRSCHSRRQQRVCV